MKWIPFVGLFLLIGLPQHTEAQQLLMRLGDYNFKKGDYEGAAEIYERILDKHDTYAPATIKLAETYKKLNDLINAEHYYRESLQYPEAPHIMMLEYAQILQKKNKCKIAKIWYNKYAALYPNEERAQLLKRSCDYQEELMQKNAELYEVRSLWFNSASSDFSPTYFQDGIVFVSDRPVDPLAQGWIARNSEPVFNLFKVRTAPIDSSSFSVCNYMYVDPVLLPSPINSIYHEGSIAFSPNGKEAFLTRSGIVEEGFVTKGSNHLQLYQTRMFQNEWTEPELLSFNGKQFSIAYPALSYDNKYLYFASDMPGGYGGMDLYRVERIENRWGDIINLGPNINTEGDEVFPTLDATGRLYFASDGQIGLGGLDVYGVEEIAENDWSFPDNLGFPINTPSDDFGLIINEEGTCGYFSSNRTGSNDNIYSFSRPTASIQVIVYNDRTGELLPDALVKDSCTQNTLYTNVIGKAVFDVPLSRCCTFTATLEGYERKQMERCTENLFYGDEVTLEIPLRQRLSFGLTGIVFDQYTGLPLSNATVYLIKEGSNQPTATLVTTISGRFTFDLEEKACYSIQVTHGDYKSKKQEDICTMMDRSEVLLAKVYLDSNKEADE
ncbi:MAG: carboxypeptidase regulatory-like domain-containing protein [Bacteroidota bacterium]